ncbi:MAG: site-specific integrase [Butyrivibrio sp.]|nr:site-specific integrase [Butyrivibrio sp.]
MAKNKKRADGYFCKTFIYNGKRYCVYAKTVKELDKKVYEKKQALEQGKEEHDNPSFKGFYDAWAESRQGIVTPATLRSQQCHYNTISKIKINGIAFENYRLSQIKAEDIRIIQRTLLDNGNKAQTVNDKIHFLSHIFSDALKEQYITFNPCSAVRPLKKTDVKARDSIHRALTIEETKKFFSMAENSFYLNVYKMAINTGMRIGEIGALKNSDIYDDKIHIERTITRLQNGSYTIGDYPKTESGKRTIPLNKAIIAILDNQRKLNKILDGNISDINGLIFKAPERGLLMATPIDRDIKNICKRTSIKHFTTHAFRATFATRAIEQNMPVRTLQEILGHSDYGITMNLYGHVLDNTKEQAMNNIEIAL